MDKEISDICDRIREQVPAEKIILFNVKNSHSGRPSSFKLCVVADVSDPIAAESRIYKEVDSDIPYDVLVYTAAEWSNLLKDTHSFAHRIAQKGTIVYE